MNTRTGEIIEVANDVCLSDDWIKLSQMQKELLESVPQEERLTVWNDGKLFEHTRAGRRAKR